MTMNPLVDYLLRDIEPRLWARVKARAKTDRIPMRAALLQLAEAYADGIISIDRRATVRAGVPVRRAK